MKNEILRECLQGLILKRNKESVNCNICEKFKINITYNCDSLFVLCHKIKYVCRVQQIFHEIRTSESQYVHVHV
jgi:hypothetical protein